MAERKFTREIIVKLIQDCDAFLELNDDSPKPFRVWARARKAALANARNGNMYYAFKRLHEMKEHGNALSQNFPDDLKEHTVNQLEFIRLVIFQRFQALGKIIMDGDGLEFDAKTIRDSVQFAIILRSLEIIT